VLKQLIKAQVLQLATGLGISDRKHAAARHQWESNKVNQFNCSLVRLVNTWRLETFGMCQARKSRDFASDPRSEVSRSGASSVYHTAPRNHPKLTVLIFQSLLPLSSSAGLSLTVTVITPTNNTLQRQRLNMPPLAELDVNVPPKSSEKVRSEEHCPVPCGIGRSLVRFKLLSA
jgi:hypothetical protein